jgi:hypothetical protein
MSESRFLPVSPTLLQTNLGDLEHSPRGYSPDELRTMARSIDDVYTRMDGGATRSELLALRTSADPHERSAGEAYAAVFRGRDSSHPLRADLVDGRLVVDSGNHRVRAAQDLGIRALPVEVRGRDVAELARVETHNARAVGPDYSRACELTDRAAGQRPRERQRNR